MKKEVEGYKASSAETEAEKQVAQSTQSSYEILVAAIEHYHDANYKRATLVDELLKINIESLGDTGKATYEKITKEVYAAECQELYPIATRSYEAVNYKRALECLERIVLLDEKYSSGEALYMLLDIYHKQNETDKATEKYNRILELFPDTDVANRAKTLMTPKEQATTE